METISETLADANTRALYADIKLTMGVVQVNLIWRRLAVRPSVIRFAWQALRTHYLNRTIPNAAWLLRDQIEFPIVYPPTDTELRDLGDEYKTMSVLDDVLRTYERGNAQNLIALCYLRSLLSASPKPSERPLTLVLEKQQILDEKTDQVFVDIPVLPESGSLALEMTQLVDEMSLLWVPKEYQGMTPSVFRHVTHWPNWTGVLAKRFRQFKPITHSELDTMANQALEQAGQYGCQLDAATHNGSALSDDDYQWLESTLECFIGGMLARGVVIVPMMRQLIPAR